MDRLILIGAGGYAKSVLDSIDYYNYQLVGFLDEFTNENEHLGFPIVAKSFDDLKNAQDYVYFVCIGGNVNRKKWFDRLVERNLKTINVVDRSAIVSRQATIGTGCFVGKLAIINSKAEIGDDVILNSRALVEHGCHVGNHVNIATNSVINGDVIIGEGSYVGSCAVVLGQKHIGEWTMIGAGAVVTKDVEGNKTVAGVPARIIRDGVLDI